MADTDIDFLDFNSAREYVLAFITTLKSTQKERAISEEEMGLWEKRVRLAENRGEPVLKKAAEERVTELKAEQARLREEETALKSKVDVLKEKLKAIRIRSSLSVDADALLAQLQMAVGEEDTLKKKMKEQEADQALRELKRKMGNGPKG